MLLFSLPVLDKWRFKSARFFIPVLQNICLISKLLNSFSFCIQTPIISSTLLKNIGGDGVVPQALFVWFKNFSNEDKKSKGKLILGNSHFNQPRIIFPWLLQSTFQNAKTTFILLRTYHGFVLVDLFPMLQNWGFNFVMYLSQGVLILCIYLESRVHNMLCLFDLKVFPQASCNRDMKRSKGRLTTGRQHFEQFETRI